MVNTIQNTLITEKSDKEADFYIGKTDNNRTVFFQSLNNLSIGQTVNISITQAVNNTLHGKLL